ncbi:MAG TPA: acyl-CoA dehydrogenase family protein [Candidatus Dormibacteraeota bacterium]|nr:acyl-CoA dehydrogenase family protein [Candidatus Dormibacteraeota bacterium]
MPRTLMDEEHEMFRSSYREFLDRDVVPHHAAWESDGIVPRSVWQLAGRKGFLGLGVPEEYGGAGSDDFRFNVVATEETARAGASGLGFQLHTDIVAPYLLRLATEEQKRRWLPGFCSGDMITAVAMSEPGAGSDLQGVQTAAVRSGDDFVVNGAKTFISNGISADLVIVVARTEQGRSRHALTLLCVERGMPGFQRGRNLDKIGRKAQDTSELFFDDVRVPVENVLGEVGGGFAALMANLAQERLSIAVSAMAGAEFAFEITATYCRERKAFDRPIGTFQHNRFLLAEMATELQVGRAFLDRCISEHVEGRLAAETAAMAKLWCTELEKTVTDRCLQLHGGYGYMTEFRIARAFLDARAQTIYGGTSEIMKEIVGRALGF